MDKTTKMGLQAVGLVVWGVTVSYVLHIGLGELAILFIGWIAMHYSLSGEIGKEQQ